MADEGRALDGRCTWLVTSADQQHGSADRRSRRFARGRPRSPDLAAPLRVRLLFSGYGGLDLAVEEVFKARTKWFSEISKPVARVFSHHWPTPKTSATSRPSTGNHAPADILCGGFPRQDVSTVGKMAGLRPGTRSALWTHMAAAIDTLQPEYVVVENLRGLLSAPANLEEDDDEQRNPERATPRSVRTRS